MNYDFSNEKSGEFDCIPAKTVVPIRIEVQAGDHGTPENAFKITKTGLLQLVLECTITEGEYARRKVWQRLTFGALPQTAVSEGQQKSMNYSRAMVRSILEAARGYTPTEESPEAVAARKFDSVFELDGMEVWVELGVEKSEGYDDRNTIKKIVPRKQGIAYGINTHTPQPRQGSLPMSGGNSAARPAQGGSKPAWAT